jgi:myo-inositol-1(or 4)-monophosphatase
MTTPRDPLPTAVAIVREAARLIRTTVRPRWVRLKSAVTDIQTSTDIAVERLIRARLAAAFPHDAVVGEEGDGFTPFDLGRPTWFVDPVDGTTNYHRGLPLVACNLAFWDGERLACAVVADVMNRRIHSAAAGRGAWRGRQRLAVATTPTLATSVVSTGFPADRVANGNNNVREFNRMVLRVRDVRRIGAAGLDLSYVAAGVLDAYWERGDGPWDWAAGALLVREAGGRVTTWDGREWVPGLDNLVASNEAVHDEVLDQIAAVAARPVTTTPGPAAAGRMAERSSGPRRD